MLNNSRNIPFRSSEGLISLFLIIITLAIFWPVHTYEFINYDDGLYVYENPHIQDGLTWQGIRWAFSADLISDSPNADYWIPLTFLSHMLTIELFGMDASMHHMVNVFFHLLNTLLLFVVLHQMTGGMWQSAFVATLFAIHPLHVESVAWITERKDVLSTFFWLLTMWAYLQYTIKPNLYRYLLVILAFVLGLMAKPMLITLPFVLLLLDYWPLNRLPLGNLKTIRGLLWEKIPLMVLMIIFIGITYMAQKGSGVVGSIESLSVWGRIENSLVSYTTYIGKMLWPHNLAIFYPHPGNSLPLWIVLGSGLLLISISVLMIWWMPRKPYLGVGWLWFLGTLVPVIGFVQVGAQAMADRYTYVPLIGLFIIISWGIPDFLNRWKHQRALSVVLAGITLSALVITTVVQLQHWENSVTLFEHTSKVTINNNLAHNNLGVALASEKKFQQAIIHYSHALRIDPNYSKAHYNMGRVLASQGKLKEARVYYSHALRINPNDPDAHNNMGVILASQGMLEEATSHYYETLRINPDDANMHNNLGVVLFDLGKLKEARTHLHHALRLKPNYAKAHNNLGLTYNQLGDFKKAIKEYQSAIIINPEFFKAYYNLGNIYIKKGKLDEAIDAFEKALKLNPQFNGARKNLALAIKKNQESRNRLLGQP